MINFPTDHHRYKCPQTFLFMDTNLSRLDYAMHASAMFGLWVDSRLFSTLKQVENAYNTKYDNENK